jgi:fibronectin-binding autotransporter adhesin
MNNSLSKRGNKLRNRHRVGAPSGLTRIGLGFTALALFSALPVQAAPQLWDGLGADGNWSSIGNFAPGAPFTIADDLQFDGNNFLTTNANDLGIASVASLTFNTGADAFTLNGKALFIGSGGITNLSSNLQTINLAQTGPMITQIWDAGTGGLRITSPVRYELSGGSVALTVTGDGNTSIEGLIDESGGALGNGGSLIKSGTGTLTLTNAANSYSGGTTVTGGLINFATGTTFGPANITLDGGGLQWAIGNTDDISSRLNAFGAGGATFDTNGNDVTFDSALIGVGGLTKSGAGTLALTNAANSYGGGTTINAGRLSVSVESHLGTGGLSFFGGELLVDGGSFVTAKNIEIFDGGTGRISNSNTESAADFYGNIVLGTGSTLAIGSVGNTGIVTLSPIGGSSTAASNIRVDFGTLRNGNVTGFSLLTGTAATTTVALGATLDANGYDSSVNYLQGAGLLTNNGGFRESSQFSESLDFSALAAPLPGGITFTITGGVFSGSIDDGTGSVALAKIGSTTDILTLSGVSNFTGGTTITGGLINFAAGNNLGTANITVDGGGLQWAAGNTTDISNRLNALGASGATFDTNGNDVIFASGLTGPGSVTKTGAGTLGLTNAVNDYTGETKVDGGILGVLSGGRITSTSSVVIGTSPGDVGTLTVQGSTSQLDTAGSFYVGSGGTGTFNIRNGGTVNSGFSVIGSQLGSIGTVSVDGAGSKWTISSSLLVDAGGAATLAITNGGEVASSSGTIASSARLSGTVSVDGIGSKWTNAFQLVVGESGPGTLNVLNGGQVTSSQGVIGSQAASVGIATVSGAGSRWTMTGDLLVDTGGTGTLNITNGGVVSNATGILATLNFQLSGTATVDGAGSHWINSGNVIVGDTGPGTLTISNAGQVSANSGAGTVTLANNAGSRGTLNIGAGSGAGALNATAVNGGAGTAILNFNHTSASYTFVPIITGSIAVNHVGSGTTVLNGANTYVGATTVNAGTLRVNGSLGAASAVAVNSGATLGGIGTVSGAVTVANGGTLAPGNSPGTITLGSLVLNNTSALAYELGALQPPGIAGTDSDLINVTGALALDGLLNVTNTGAFGTGTYRLINYGGAFTNNTLDLASAPGGFGYRIDTTTAGQVNLVVGVNGLQFWDGLNTAANNVIDGGTATWNNGTSNWTNSNGSLNGAWGNQTGVFSGIAGTVTLGDNIAFAGLQFLTDGYVINADATNHLSLVPTINAQILVDPGVTATLNARITGAGGLVKIGTGTMILAGANTYDGGTTLNAGTLLANHQNALGTGVLTINGGTLGSTSALLIALPNNIVVQGSFAIAAPAQGLVLNGTVNLGGTTPTITSTTPFGITTFNKRLSGSGGVEFTSAGPAVFRLASPTGNTYGGLTTISGAAIVTTLGADSIVQIPGSATIRDTASLSLGYSEQIANTSSVTVLSNGQPASMVSPAVAGFDLGGHSETIGALFGSGTVGLNSSTAGTLAIGSGDFSGVIRDSVRPGDTTGGRIVKTTSGTLILSGINTFTGTTTINAGTLRVNGSLGAGSAVSVNNGGTLGGTGTVHGPVTVALGGTLAPGNSPGPITLGTLTLNSGSFLSYELATPNVIGSGVNDLTIVNGPLTLDGTLNITELPGFGAGLYRLFDYTGLLTNNTLDIGSAPGGYTYAFDVTTPHQVNVLVTAGGPLPIAFWNGPRTTPNGVVNGGTSTWDNVTTNWTNQTGSVSGTWGNGVGIFAGAAGTVTLVDNIHFTALQFFTDGYLLNAAGSYALRPTGLAPITTESGVTATINAPITGSGGLAKEGLGTLVLTGASTYTGNTLINGGSLLVNGSLTSPNVFVNPGALLGGSGVLLGQVFNSGLVSPGNSPGKLTIKGHYTQASAGTLRIEVAGRQPGQFDVLEIGGQAQLDGTLQIVRTNNAQLKRGDRLEILTAEQGVSGEFSQVINPFPSRTILQPAVVYEDDAVILTTVRASFAKLDGLTPNQRAVAQALDRITNDRRAEKIFAYLDERVLDKLPADFDQISPEELTSIFHLVNSLANLQGLNLQRRAGELRNGARGFSAAGLAMQGSAPGYAGTMNFRTGAAGPTGHENKDSKEIFAPAPDQRWGVFLTGVGEWVDVDGDGNARGYDITTGGFTLGLDYKVTPHFAVGLAAGYAGTGIDLSDDGSVLVNGGKLALYATTFRGGWYADAAVSGGYNSYDTKRSALEGTARGSTEGGELSVLVGTGYDWKIGALQIGPTATFNYTLTDLDGYTEDGSLAPLDIAGGDSESIRSAFGLKASYDWRIGSVIVRPEVRAAWQHEYGDRSHGIDASFANGAGGTFLVHGPEIGRDSLLLGAGFAVQCGERYSTYLYYDGELGRQRYDSHSVSAGLRVSF